jgi:hypothetical protein
MMRDTYQERLDQVLTELEPMTQTVSLAVRRTTAARLDADLQAAGQVIAADPELDAAGPAAENKIVDLIALQAPVVGELRMLIAALPAWPAAVPRAEAGLRRCPIARWCPSYGTGPTDPEQAAKLVEEPG